MDALQLSNLNPDVKTTIIDQAKIEGSFGVFYLGPRLKVIFPSENQITKMLWESNNAGNRAIINWMLVTLTGKSNRKKEYEVFVMSPRNLWKIGAYARAYVQTALKQSRLK